MKKHSPYYIYLVFGIVCTVSFFTFILPFSSSKVIAEDSTTKKVTVSEKVYKPYISIPYDIVESWKNKGSFFLTTRSGTEMKALQYFLQSKGYTVIASGVFDAKTRSALLDYQRIPKGLFNEKLDLEVNAFMRDIYCPSLDRTVTDQDFRLMNVNRERVLPQNFTPPNLQIETNENLRSDGPVCLDKEAFAQLVVMYKDAEKEGVPLFITSSFRGEESQSYLLKYMVQRLGSTAYQIVALPGKSEHNLGTAVDFAGYEDGKLVPVASGRQIAWLEKNASKYGFVRSYPDAKEHITGFRSEPWHWRYVGIPLATQVKKEKITLAEFFDKYNYKIGDVVGGLKKYSGIFKLNDVTIGG